MRPDNLDPDRLPGVRRSVRDQARWFTGRPEGDPTELARALFDLDEWARVASELRRSLAAMIPRLGGDGATPLAEGFELAAATLRHIVADPLLPPALWPVDWPAAALRADHRRYDIVYRAELAAFFRADRRTLTS